MEFLKKRWVYHSLIWGLILFVFAGMTYSSAYHSNGFFQCFKDSLIFLIPVAPIVYLSLWAKEYFFDKRQYFIYFLVAAGIVAIGVLLYEFIDGLDGEMGNPRSQNITNYIFFQLIAVGIQYFKRGIVNQYQIQELRAKTAETELNALKAQLNPHFLFNTLNNIYAINHMNAEKGSEMIMELSEVMRYHLEFSKVGKVKLADEIQLLNSYIKLEKLRLRETCDVQINFENADESLMISPLLFIPFVENAFKHGTHPTKACFVHIALKTIGNKLLFTVRNSMITNRKVVKTNIGLANTKRRLALVFPEKHNLQIDQNEEEHSVELQIDL